MITWNFIPKCCDPPCKSFEINCREKYHIASATILQSRYIPIYGAISWRAGISPLVLRDIFLLSHGYRSLKGNQLHASSTWVSKLEPAPLIFIELGLWLPSASEKVTVAHVRLYSDLLNVKNFSLNPRLKRRTFHLIF